MNIQTRLKSGITILDVSGPLKLGDAEETFRTFVEDAMTAGADKLVINLAGVSEMDSSGIGALVRVHSSCKQRGGACRLFGLQKRVLQTLKMVRLYTLLDIVEDETAALAGL